MAAIKPNRVRYQLFLPEDLSHRFEALARDRKSVV